MVPDWRTYVKFSNSDLYFLKYIAMPYFACVLPFCEAATGRERRVFRVVGVQRHVNAVARFVVRLTSCPVDFPSKERSVHRAPAIIFRTLDVGSRSPVRVNYVVIIYWYFYSWLVSVLKIYGHLWRVLWGTSASLQFSERPVEFPARSTCPSHHNTSPIFCG